MKHENRRLNSAPTSHLRVRRRGVSQALISQDPPNQQQERPSALRHPIIYHSLGGDFTPAFTCLVLNNRTKCTKFTCDQHCCQLYLHVTSARSSLRHSIHFVCYKSHLGSLTPYHYSELHNVTDMADISV